MSKKNKKYISKFIAYILRHNPGKFGLEPDLFGYVDIYSLISVVQKKYPKFNRESLQELVRGDKKGRYQIKENKIRARYGHSIDVKPEQAPVRPPEHLYHGTSPQAAEKILQSGLKSMNRQYVHLSINREDAKNVGRRHCKRPLILKILALKAHQAGYNFIREKNTFLVKKVPSQYIIKN